MIDLSLSSIPWLWQLWHSDHGNDIRAQTSQVGSAPYDEGKGLSKEPWGEPQIHDQRRSGVSAHENTQSTAFGIQRLHHYGHNWECVTQCLYFHK